MGYFSLNDRKRKNELLCRMSPWLCLLSFQLSLLVQLQEHKIRISRILPQLFACLIMTDNKQAMKPPMSLASAEAAPAAGSEECAPMPLSLPHLFKKRNEFGGLWFFSFLSGGRLASEQHVHISVFPLPLWKFHTSPILKPVSCLNVAYGVICLWIIWLLSRHWNTLLSKYLATANSTSRHH